MYMVGAKIVWVLVFIASYFVAIAEYGFMLGGGLGWIPAAIVATIAAAIWPLPAVALLFVAIKAIH